MLTNKYSKLYFAIITRAKQRTIDGYTETHHIMPQSIGGGNDKENLVELTAREHFMCHWLLVKMTTGEDYHKMRYALMNMKAENEHQNRYHTKITARVYERYRIEHAMHHSKLMKSKNLVPWNKGGADLTDEQRNNIKVAALTRKIDPIKQAEGQRKRIAKVTGQKRSKKTKLKMSLAKKGIPKGPMSEKEKLKRSIALKGKPKRKGHSSKVRKAVLGNISINKDGTEKKVKKDILQQYIDQGWQLGGRKRK